MGTALLCYEPLNTISLKLGELPWYEKLMNNKNKVTYVHDQEEKKKTSCGIEDYKQ